MFQTITVQYILEVQTKFKCSLSKDRDLLRRVAELVLKGTPPQILEDMIQRHFVELTDRFMQPLNRFFDSLLVGNPLEM
jgi:hypothetical protein